jgi:dipeptidyl aminopeptidase/acylaminoacyl peptidase
MKASGENLEGDPELPIMPRLAPRRSVLSLLCIAVAAVVPAPCSLAQASGGFTLPQVLSAPFPSELKAAPALGRVSWISDAEGRRNLWMGEAADGKYKARQLTHYTDDDGIDLGDVAWSQDARKLAYVRGGDFEATSKPGANPALLPGGNEQNIWLISLDGGVKPAEAVKIAAGHSPVFTRNGDALIYLCGGQIWMVRLDTPKKVGQAEPASEQSKPDQMLHTRGEIDDLRLSPDGARLAFVSGRGDHSFVGVYDFAAKSLLYLDPSTDSDGAPAWSPQSDRVAFLRNSTGNDDYEFAPRRTAPLPWSIRIADAKTGQSREVWKAASGQGSNFHGLAAENQLFWTAGERIVFPSEADGWLHLYAVSAAGGAASLLTPGEFEVEHAAVSQDRTELVYSSNQGDIDRRHIWKLAFSDAEVGKPAAVTSGEGIEVQPAVASDGKTVLVLRSDARLPMRAAAVDGGRMADLAPESMPKDFPAAKLVVPQQVIFSSVDGMMIHGQLFLPANAGAGPHPALVFFHGGSRRQMLLGWHYMQYYNNAYAMNQYLASQGYVVLSVNYRSGIGYGMNFREALNYGAAGASEFNDVLGAGLFLRSRTDVDPARIGSWGGSYGGYLTALALARASDLFAAGVDFHGVHDWNIELGNWNANYDPNADPNRARVAYESSPVASVSTWRSPVLLIHGDDDRNVQFSQTPKLAGMLRKENVHVEELIFPDEIHDFLLHRDWLKAYAAETDFFARYFKH